MGQCYVSYKIIDPESKQKKKTKEQSLIYKDFDDSLDEEDQPVKKTSRLSLYDRIMEKKSHQRTDFLEELPEKSTKMIKHLKKGFVSKSDLISFLCATIENRKLLKFELGNFFNQTINQVFLFINNFRCGALKQKMKQDIISQPDYQLHKSIMSTFDRDLDIINILKNLKTVV